MSNTPTLEPLYDVTAVCKHLHIGRTGVFALIGEGSLKSVKVGRKRLVPASALAEYVEQLKAAA